MKMDLFINDPVLGPLAPVRGDSSDNVDSDVEVTTGVAFLGNTSGVTDFGGTIKVGEDDVVSEAGEVSPRA